MVYPQPVGTRVATTVPDVTWHVGQSRTLENGSWDARTRIHAAARFCASTSQLVCGDAGHWYRRNQPGERGNGGPLSLHAHRMVPRKGRADRCCDERHDRQLAPPGQRVHDRDTAPFMPAHITMAAMLDALYKIHFGSSFLPAVTDWTQCPVTKT